MSFFKILIELFIGTPEKRAKQRIRDAQQRFAEMDSHRHFHAQMADFFTDRVLSIDPWQDHWGFADARADQLHHQERACEYEKRAAAAHAAVAAIAASPQG